MGRDLTNLYIDETFQYLLQKSGSEVQNGLGVKQDFLDVSASYAVTASFALNAGGADTGSLLVTASVSDATLTFTKGDGSTFDVTVNNVESSSHALVADTALTTITSQYSDNTVVTGKNVSGAEILKGTPLYFTGSGTSGNLVGVWPADASNPNRMPAAGVAGETLAIGAEGVVLLDGFISGVPTTGFQSGQQVYVGVGGGYQATRPTGSNNLVQGLGYIEKVHPSNGSGVIRGAGRSNDVPNIQQGYLWVGGAGDLPVTVQTGSLSVAYATNALSASYAVSASYEIIKEISSSYADYAKEAGYATSSLSASYAVTASHALNAGTWDGQFSGSAGITGSLTVLGDSTVRLTDGDISSNFTVSKGTSSYTLSINQFPGFTGSIISANNVDEFKVTGDTAIALDNTGYAGTNQVAVRASDTVRLESVNGVEVKGSTNITGHNQNTLRLQTTGSSDYVEVSGPVSPPFTFDGNYIKNVNYFRDSNDFNFIQHSAGGNTTIAATGSATTKVTTNVNGAEVVRVQENGLSATGLFDVYTPNTGSDYFKVGNNDAYLYMSIGGFDPGSGWLTTSNMTFGAADTAFFSAENAFYIKNIYDGQGSVYIWSENEATLRGDTGVVIQGNDGYGVQDPIDIRGKAFAHTIASNINGFSTTISQNSNVRQGVRAFVETPMQVGSGITVTIETGATLKVINEL